MDPDLGSSLYIFKLSHFIFLLNLTTVSGLKTHKPIEKTGIFTLDGEI